MLYYLPTEFLLSNNSVTGARVSVLSNSVKNILYFSALTYLGALNRCNSTMRWLLPLTCISAKANLLPALTNTLFSVHPPLLYITVVMAAISLSHRNAASAYRAAPAFALSIFLGGFWSMQELSWGGWWNWDVLECGIAYIWVVFIAAMHTRKRKSQTCRSLQMFCVVIIWLVYTGLNKYGLATSIHSFVASKSTRTHYPCIIMTYASLTAFCNCRSFIAGYSLAFAMTLAYLSLQWCIFLKKPLMLLVVVGVFTTKPYRPALRTYHSLVVYVSALILATNLFNHASFGFTRHHLYNSTLNCSGPFWCFDMSGGSPGIALWKELFLSKPRYSYGPYLKVSSFRGVSGRYVTLCFMK